MSEGKTPGEQLQGQEPARDEAPAPPPAPPPGEEAAEGTQPEVENEPAPVVDLDDPAGTTAAAPESVTPTAAAGDAEIAEPAPATEASTALGDLADEDGVYTLYDEEGETSEADAADEETDVVVAPGEPRPSKRPTLDLDHPPTEEGYLDEEPLAEEPTPAEASETVQVGGTTLTLAGRDAMGRQLASTPDGAQVLFAGYRGDPTLLAGLYPHPILPPLIANGASDDGRLLAAHPLPQGRSLEDALTAGDAPAVLKAVTDVARFNRYLVARGAALCGLEPRDVTLSPTRFARLPNLQAIGSSPPASMAVYGPPERAAGAPVTGEEGAFTLGAVLYRALGGRALSEGEFPTFMPARPGAPQVLGSLLGPAGERPSPAEVLELLPILERANQPRAHWTVGSASSVGLNPDRPTNEDSCGWRFREAVTDAGVHSVMVACVSDGMGGMARGEVASQAAVQAYLEPLEPPFTPGALADRVVAANQKVVEALEGSGSGGCTFTGVALDRRRGALAHVGDTRAYRVRAEKSEQLTEDHSVVAMLVRMGMLKPEEAHGHPDSNKVTRALGSARDLQPDYVQSFDFEVHPGDRIVLVSDGVWGPPEPAKLKALLESVRAPQELADTLVTTALEHGAPDNATALVLDYVELPPL